jgi:DNA invertase Pin-like site-specific DNA recombinase
LIGLLGDLQARDIDLYLRQQALDTSTPSGRMLFGMLGVSSEFERAMIRDRVMAGLDRARQRANGWGGPGLRRSRSAVFGPRWTKGGVCVRRQGY